ESVEFFANGASLGFGHRSSTNGSIFTFDWVASQPGWFTLTVRATDTQGAAATSPVVRVAVGTNGPDPEIPDLHFRLAFNDPNSGRGVFFRDYTLDGQVDGLRLLPATRVVPDSSAR